MKKVLTLFFILMSINFVIALEITSPGTYDVSAGDTISLENGMTATITEITNRVVEFVNSDGNPFVFIVAEGSEFILKQGQYTEIIPNEMTTPLMGVMANSIDLNAGKASITISDLLAEDVLDVSDSDNLSDDARTSNMKYVWVGIIVIAVLIILYSILRKKKDS